MVPSPRSFAAIKKFLLPLLVCWNIQASTAFVPAPSVAAARANRIRRFTAENSNNNASSADKDDSDSDSDNDQPNAVPSSLSPSFEMDTATVRIDDGGSNLTDRFKHKVHALMGDYDPAEGTADDENQDGNIMRALITFPMLHTFDVVGRVSAEEQTNPQSESDNESDNESDDYAERVKRIVFETTGDENTEVEVVPRGKKFTKVRCRAMVESTAMINAIYDELGRMESTVMKF